MGACCEPSAFITQIVIGPQPAPVLVLQRSCRLNPIQPFLAFLHVTLGLDVGDGVGVSVGLGVGEGVTVAVGVFVGLGLGVWEGVGVLVTVGILVAVGVAAPAGAFVAVGASAVSVAAAAFSTATCVPTRSGVGVGSPPHAVRISSEIKQQSFQKGNFTKISPLSSETNN